MKGKLNKGFGKQKEGFDAFGNTTGGANIEAALKRAKTTGSLNLQGRGLSVFPEDICKFSDLRLLDNWWESYELTKLDMANNSIASIPSELSTQEQLFYLNFNSNLLEEVPGEIFSLVLKFFDASHNKLKILPDMIGSCNSLVELHLAGNQISELPFTFGGLENLEVLDLKRNDIEYLPKSLSGCVKLKKLDLSENSLTKIPETIGFCEMLTDVNFSKNHIENIELYSLERLSNLVLLDLHQNKLTYFESVPKSTKLDTIILGFNFIEEIANLHNAPNLTVLDLHNNKMEELPETILDMDMLKTLNISNNNMNNLPPRLALLDNLVRIQIEGNPLKSIKSSMRMAKAPDLKNYLRLRLDVKEEEKLERKKAQDRQLPGASSRADPWEIYLREYFHNNQLILQRKSVLSISPILWDYDELTLLDLSHNEITSIPEEIHHLSNLLSLRLSHNKLTSLPESLSQMAGLKELEIGDNPSLGGFFTDKSIIRLESLSYLNLSNTGLTAIPLTLKKLPNLATLHLSHNNITDIKELCREEFTGLKVLDLSLNKVTEIPKAFAYFLIELNFLNVVNNELKRLPHNLGFHKTLKTVQLDGNPLKSIRRAIIDGGSARLLQYLADKYTEEEDGQIEEWAIRKKGAKKGAMKKAAQEEEKYQKDSQASIYERQTQEPKVAGLKKKSHHIFEQSDHIGDKAKDARKGDHEEIHGFKDPNKMYADRYGASQPKEDFFWGSHQREVDHQYQSSHPSAHPPAPIPEVPKASHDPFPEEAVSTESQRTKKDMIEELKILDDQIRQLIDDIDNNFSLSKRDIQERRRELHKVQAQRNKLNNDIAS
ncbi:unnamed protein product [Moneuplotes crassus]|uniref:Uncharacterized protein n=1 Tax=Euplotes crassus TaxID=5936 RepID=A0AAD1Y3U5_EUPCR|nr:unnamed protein product [Moneuplotes crassus]